LSAHLLFCHATVDEDVVARLEVRATTPCTVTDAPIGARVHLRGQNKYLNAVRLHVTLTAAVPDSVFIDGRPTPWEVALPLLGRDGRYDEPGENECDVSIHANPASPVSSPMTITVDWEVGPAAGPKSGKSLLPGQSFDVVIA